MMGVTIIITLLSTLLFLFIEQPTAYSLALNKVGLESSTANTSAITNNPNPTPPAAKNVTSCDPLLLNNIANRSAFRFKVINPCVTITGKVTLVHFPPDGDTVFALKLDKPFSSMVTKANFNNKMKGGIWVELICQRPNKNTEEVHRGDCQAPPPAHIIHFFTPKKGDTLQVTGQYQQDLREGGHMEIHPTSDMRKIH
jgi:hypothetical protein